MEAVIPNEVLAHLREMSAASPLDGKFTTPQLADRLNCGENKARALIRELLRSKRVRAHRVGLTDEDAWELGFLGAGNVLCYEWLGEPS